ncbi:creatininase family protein [Roseomonas sp. BN140053]|uniref:creatininase family protein n=1 Tax=Roseomonas sp. BN140053 TaxID=3391898 RepID=UPI0039ED6079
MPIRTRFWAELRWPEFRDLPDNTVAVLPVASIEQHGPHLPVSVDTTINQGVVARTLSLLPPEVPVLVLPTQCVGVSVEHLAFPGTLTTTPEILLALVTDIGASVARAGVKRLVVVNSHGGNVSTLDLACRRIRIQSRILALNCMWARLGKPASMSDPVENKYGIHAGQSETALMLRLAKHDVDMGKARNFVSAWQGLENSFPALSPDKGAPLGWQAQDLNPAGAVGDASKATEPLGEEILQDAGERMAALWQQVSGFDVDAWLRDAPDAG